MRNGERYASATTHDPGRMKGPGFSDGMEGWHRDALIIPLREMARVMKTLLEGGVPTSMEKRVRTPFIPFTIQYSELEPLIRWFGGLFTLGNLLYGVVDSGGSLLSALLILFREDHPVGVEEIPLKVLPGRLRHDIGEGDEELEIMKARVAEEKGEEVRWFLFLSEDGLKGLRSSMEACRNLSPLHHITAFLAVLRGLLQNRHIRAMPLPEGLKWFREVLLSDRFSVNAPDPRCLPAPEMGYGERAGPASGELLLLLMDRRSLSIIKFGGRNPFHLSPEKEKRKPPPSDGSRGVLRTVKRRYGGEVVLLMEMSGLSPFPLFMKRGELFPDIPSLCKLLKGGRFISLPPFLLHQPLVRLLNLLGVFNLSPSNLSPGKVTAFFESLESGPFPEGVRVRVDEFAWGTLSLRIRGGRLEEVRIGPDAPPDESVNGRDIVLKSSELIESIRRVFFTPLPFSSLLPEPERGQVPDTPLPPSRPAVPPPSDRPLDLLKWMGETFFERRPFPYGAFGAGIIAGMVLTLLLLYTILSLF